MEQHAIPQQISSYEFKLVGDMTLKQFLKAAVGIILAILINTTKIVVLVKWPLMLLVAGGGLALAFVPFEDRPLEGWIKSFIKSIYSPTIYTYQRKATKNWLDLDLTKVTKEENTETASEREQKIKIKSAFGENRFKQTVDILTTPKEKEEVKGEIKIIEKPIVKEEIKVVEEKIKENNLAATDWRETKTNLNLKSERLGATGNAVFGNIPMPDIPEIPNIVVGMATSNEGKIVDGVIVEIQDENGNPTRVLKSNSLGQFKTSTPLANGKYLIVAEKDNYQFNRVNIEIKGEIIKPIRIIANN
jgi:hypothetical protein